MMTIGEFVLCNFGMFTGLLIYFVASKTDRPFGQSICMALGGSIVLVCAIITAVYMFNSVVIGQINTVTIPDIRIGAGG